MSQYTITYEMVIELLYRYLEKIYILNKHKGKSVVKIQQLYELNEDLKLLTKQLQEKGHDIDVLIREIKQTLEKQYRYEKIEVYIDGAARGNNDPNIPNKSGIAFAIYGDSQILSEQAIFLGGEIQLPRLKNEPNDLILPQVPATNNTTEYIALIELLKYMIQEGITANHIKIHSDSSIVVNQVNMVNTTKAEHLIRLRNCAQELIDEFDNISLIHIPREENSYVDGLVNKLLDKEEEAS